MSGFLGILVIAALFALRFLAPVAIIIATGYLMNRMYVRWEAEEAAAHLVT